MLLPSEEPAPRWRQYLMPLGQRPEHEARAAWRRAFRDRAKAELVHAVVIGTPKDVFATGAGPCSNGTSPGALFQDKDGVPTSGQINFLLCPAANFWLAIPLRNSPEPSESEP